MKNRLKKIAWLLLLCMAVTIGTDGVSVAQMQAAGQTAAQKAKAQREKEKAKQAKARAKAKAKAAKEREKAAKQKAKPAQQAKPAKQAQPVQPAKLSSDEQWELKVAEIEKYNAYVARYMSRDITHRVGFWGQVGYSDLFATKFQYNTTNQTGFEVQNQGRAGGGGGVGYQMRYKRLLMTTGLEMQVYTSLYELSGGEQGVMKRSFGVLPYAQELEYNYRFTDCQDQLKAGFVQIPVLLGMEFANKYAYFLAGPKIGLGAMGVSNVSGNLTTTIKDKVAIDPYVNMASHAMVNGRPYATTSPLTWGLNLALYGEIGMSMDPWLNSKLVALRLAAFAEYGVMNIQTSQNIVGNNDQPVDYSRVLAGGHPVNDVAMVSSLATTTSAAATVNPFLVGVKATCWFNLPRKELRQKSIPKQPMPGMTAQVVNLETGLGLAGAIVTITSPEMAAMTKTTNGKGVIAVKMPKGTYTLSASKVGYYDASVDYSLLRDMRDTLVIGLRPEPKPVVYTLAGRVRAKETNHALEAEVHLTSLDATTLYSGVSADDGLFVTNLGAGSYVAHLRCQGYMPLDDTIRFYQDTLAFTMTKIKEGVKVKVENLYYATNRTYILPESESALQNLADFLLDNVQVRIRIVGHTDNVGSDQANQILSEGRAESLRMELIKRGVEAHRMEYEGRGEREPVATNDTEEGRALNRRVEFTILSAGK